MKECGLQKLKKGRNDSPLDPLERLYPSQNHNFHPVKALLDFWLPEIPRW